MAALQKLLCRFVSGESTWFPCHFGLLQRALLQMTCALDEAAGSARGSGTGATVDELQLRQEAGLAVFELIVRCLRRKAVRIGVGASICQSDRYLRIVQMRQQRHAVPHHASHRARTAMPSQGRCERSGK